MRNKLFKISLNRQGKARYLLLFGISFLLFFFIAGSSQQLHAQEELTVTGEVIDAATEEPLPGVSVVIEGTTIGTITDEEGRYSLEVREPSDVLEFSFIGYMTQIIEVGDQRTIDVELAVSAVDLEEIVVVGFGTQRRGDITGSVSSIGEEEFRTGAIRDAAQLIQGSTPGVQVGVTSGDPTETAEISLRGISSLLGDSEPLVIIDGVPGNLKSVAPEDIESVNILKDGAAAAIYGTRGSDGVILITTRRAERDITSIEYSTYFGTQEVTKKMDILSAEEMRQKIEEGYNFHDYGYNTDWQEEVSRDLPIQQNHNLFMQGGTGETSYTVSLNYRDWQGLFLNSNNEELQLRMNANHSMFDDRLRMNVSLNTNRQNYDAGSDYGGSFTQWGGYVNAIQHNPTAPVKDDEGNWFEDPEGYGTNPVANLEEAIGLTTNRNMRLSGNISFQPVENLNMNLLLANNINRGRYTFERTFDHSATVLDGEDGYASTGNDGSEELLLEFTTNYEYTLEEHSFTLLGGYSWQENTWEEAHMNNWRFPISLSHLPPNMGFGDAHTEGESRQWTYRSSSRLIGFFGRINYNYDDRYMLMGSIRREGSTRFGEDHRWGNFPAISAGWRISQESFIQDTDFANILDNLMLRIGYGITGIEPTEPYLSKTMLDFGARGYYRGNWTYGLEPSQNPNPDLRWEQQKELNVGLEFAILNNRIGAEFDFYQRYTEDLLWDMAVPVPPNLYSEKTMNIGEMESTGFEAHLKLVPVRTSDFEWRTDLGYSTNTAKLVSLSTEDYEMERDYFYTGHGGQAQLRAGTHVVELGEEIGNFWTWKTVDITEDGYWIIEDADGNHIPFEDGTTEDRMVTGSGVPDFYINWNHQFHYRQFDLGISMRGAFGHQVFNHTYMRTANPNITGHNIPKAAYDKVYGKAVLQGAPNLVSYYIEDADYWKIDNISLGYNFGAERLNYLDNARVYIAIQNAFTFTDYRGLDPEVSHTGLDPGKDHLNKYPTMRSFMLGADISIR